MRECHGEDLFSVNYSAGLTEVVLVYDISNEFEVTNKIDAFFEVKSRIENINIYYKGDT